MNVIQVDQVSKAYHLGAGRSSLREALPNLARQLFRRSNRNVVDEALFWALKDVSFQVQPGEALGIIGHNGAGKSTILKLLSQVTFPTRGHIYTQGRMAALIELGAGFHPDLSGRENIYLNGSILGLKRREIDAQLDSIVAFAGLEQFIDTPVKRYSSGMYVRLAFAVAAHVRADLLLVDEVLSVGDASFQQKCLHKMSELRSAGATVLFISHDLWAVSSFCQRVLLLRHGQISAEGSPEEVIRLYNLQERQQRLSSQQDPPDSSGPGWQPGQASLPEIELLDENSCPAESLLPDQALVVRGRFDVFTNLPAPVFLARIRRSDGLICCELPCFLRDEAGYRPLQGRGSFEARIGPLHLEPDIYTVEVHLVDGLQPVVYAISDRKAFTIDGLIEESHHAGVFKPDIEWSFSHASETSQPGRSE